MSESSCPGCRDRDALIAALRQAVQRLEGKVQDLEALAVIWRKKCLGSQSEAGCVFVGRLLSVVGTLRKQGRRVLDYLSDALQAHRHALPAPAILPSL